MSKRLLFLQLSPEFGGTKFGPFTAPEIRLGSDEGRNDIVLPEGLGVASEHVRLHKQGEENFVLAPVDRTAGVYLWRDDGRAPKPVTSPVALGIGDGFSLVSAEGPRFFLIIEAEAKEEKGDNKGLKGAKDRLSTGSMLEELKRQGMARFLTTWLGGTIETLWVFIKSGTIFQPRYIFTGLAIAAGWVMALFAGGGGLWLWSMYQDSQDQVASLDADLATCQGRGDGGDDDWTITGLTGSILGDDLGDRVEEMLSADTAFNQIYQQQLNAIYRDPDGYNWAYRPGGGNTFLDFTRRLQGANLDPDLVRLLAYLGVVPNRHRDWHRVTNSERQETCGRGPLRMTWRQADSLGFGDQVQIDALVMSFVAAQQDEHEIRTALFQNAGRELDLENPEFNTGDGYLGDDDTCVFVEGEDLREDPIDVARALADALGPRADDLPGPDRRNQWILMRVLRFFTADFRRQQGEVDYSRPTFTTALQHVSDDRAQWAMQQSAYALARAVAIPCMMTWDEEASVPDELEGHEPNRIQCAVLQVLSTDTLVR